MIVTVIFSQKLPKNILFRDYDQRIRRFFDCNWREAAANRIHPNMSMSEIYSQVMSWRKFQYVPFWNELPQMVVLSEKLLLADCGDEFLEVERLEVGYILEVACTEGGQGGGEH